jgi:MraZ protein
LYNCGTKWCEVEKGGGESIMFIGQFSHNLDDKNRITIPSKLREKLGFNAVMTIGFDQCISIYTENEWVKLQEKLLTLNTNSTDARKHIRMLAGSASECSADAQGRVIVPPNLIERADINKEVILVGNLDHIEIWSKEVWERYAKDASEKFDEIAEKL